MSTTIDIARIDLGMPCAPARMSDSRQRTLLPVIAPRSAYDRALSMPAVWQDRVTTDIAVKGAFPGARAWSPPS